MKHTAEIAKFVRNGDFEETDGGVLIHSSIMAKGKYYHTVNHENLMVDDNLVVAEGIAHFLDVTLNGATQITSWYLAPFTNNVSPAANWTAANYATNAGEMDSDTEGYTEATRQIWTSSPPSGGVIGNLAARAEFTIATASTITIRGAGLLSDSTRGGTSGVLVSSSRFTTSRVVSNADTFQLGYEVELTDS